LFEIGVDRFVAGGDFQVLRIFDEQVDKSAFGAHPRLERNLFLNAMIFANDHDQFQVPAGTQTDLPLENAFRAAFVAGVGVAHIQSPCGGFRTEGKAGLFPNLPRFENRSGEKIIAQIRLAGFRQ
jgi:hypothetical protein